MEVNIGEIIVDEEIEIGGLELDIIKEYPSLENLTVTPTGVEQNFKSSKYGYNNVKVMAINLQDKAITLNKNGIYNIKADEEYSGLNNVEVTLDAIEDLDAELNNYQEELTEQRTTIEDIIETLKGKGVIGTDEIYEQGKNDEIKRFWDIFQNYGRRTEYRNAFFGWLWKDSIYNPIYTIICSSNSSEMFRYNSSITDTKVDIDFSYANSSYVFANTTSLKTIRKLKVTENVTYTGWFASCPALENIVIEGVIGNNIDFSSCTLLTHDSLMSIINALKSGKNGSLIIGPDNIGKLTSDEIAIATDKGWMVS